MSHSGSHLSEHATPLVSRILRDYLIDLWNKIGVSHHVGPGTQQMGVHELEQPELWRRHGLRTAC